MTLSATSVCFLIAALPFVVCASSFNELLRVESVIGQKASLNNQATPEALEESDRKGIFELNRLPGRGINFSGLEHATEGDWNFKLKNDALCIIAYGSFNSVRLPIKWDSRAAAMLESESHFSMEYRKYKPPTTIELPHKNTYNRSISSMKRLPIACPPSV